ncbi:indole-3-glycerol phosphate synthase TrpC [Flavobacteriaceae bacterium F08102]|nr:indole-3-glycerol phosphate synthase TrpC [Flavobacteriaceae bacterium F08102]
MDILDKIIRDKAQEVALKKQVVSIHQLTQTDLFKRETYSLKTQLKKTVGGIIAEHKRRSPSKSVINHSLDVSEVARGYEKAGVCGMSVLTDGKYFGGSLDDLLLARASCHLPLLRKEFIIDKYQVFEAKAFGADAILLIAAVLSKEQIKTLSELAQSLGLEVLLEIHNEDELQKSLMPSIDLIGVNNRNLKTFSVDVETSRALSRLIPDEFTKVSESGISDVDMIKGLIPYGYEGFLIGECFMKTSTPGEHARAFVKQLNE